MAELRLSHVIIGLVLLVLIGGPLLICIAVLVLGFTVPGLDLGFIKTPEITKNAVDQAVDEGVGTASGYSPAKTPAEALDKFRDALQNRKYKYAKVYVTKDYADMLERAHTAANDLGTKLDRIREFGKKNGILTDKLAVILNRLDAFPKNFEAGKAPEIKGDKAYGQYVWKAVSERQVPADQLFNEFKNLDGKMYEMVLAPPAIFNNPVRPIELVKEGEDWKLNIPVKMNPTWEPAVNYYVDHYKTYDTGLDGFIINMTRDHYDTPGAFESAVLERLRNAKK